MANGLVYLTRQKDKGERELSTIHLEPFLGST
uniref:Uncharacterized protein n=1 Tax=Nelumbo nucifera TaxID=4432 RepID=A0A822ZM29_NELNU|nr:TPA_asm: hypothetical protein HUJ06_017041 [Nelumbo nucifera]